VGSDSGSDSEAPVEVTVGGIAGLTPTGELGRVPLRVLDHKYAFQKEVTPGRVATIRMPLSIETGLYTQSILLFKVPLAYSRMKRLVCSTYVPVRLQANNAPALSIGRTCAYDPLRLELRRRAVGAPVRCGLLTCSQSAMSQRVSAVGLTVVPHECSGCVGAHTAGDSEFNGAWRNISSGGAATMLMKSWSNTISLHNPATGWSGFVPDFLKLMSNELVFAYEIIDLNHVCSVELVEAFRASHRYKGPTCSADTDSYVLLYCVATWCAMA
jgi:hypothetical protein